ncbi:MAG: hypothetical protein K2X35_10140 [Bryobacteraceae bacterium]|nr:hypothetical protein [Bryobacteraceae bacterium]
MVSFLSVVRALLVPVILPVLCLADQVDMKNGDRVTDAFVKKDAKPLTLKSENHPR